MIPSMLQIYSQTRNFYLLQWKDYENVFMNYIQSSRDRENTNIETNLCFSKMSCYGNRV